MPAKKSCLFRWRELLKAPRDFTVTSLNRIMPQKAHYAIAQIQASKGSESINVAFKAVSIHNVMGGRSGRERAES